MNQYYIHKWNNDDAIVMGRYKTEEEARDALEVFEVNYISGEFSISKLNGKDWTPILSSKLVVIKPTDPVGTEY